LRSMKILDHYSIFVVALKEDIVNQHTLSRPELFGQFGQIRSIRILQESSPTEFYVRFTEEHSATAAIRWCLSQPELFKDAKNGYQKYCIKFINKQKCRKSGCPNRHSWANTKDIMSFADTRLILDESTMTDLFPQPSAESVELENLRKQCLQLQRQSEQNVAEISNLEGTLQAMEQENFQLAMQIKMANHHLQQQQEQMQQHQMEQMHLHQQQQMQQQLEHQMQQQMEHQMRVQQQQQRLEMELEMQMHPPTPMPAAPPQQAVVAVTPEVSSPVTPTYILSGRTIHPELSSYARAYALRSAANPEQMIELNMAPQDMMVTEWSASDSALIGNVHREQQRSTVGMGMEEGLGRRVKVVV